MTVDAALLEAIDRFVAERPDMTRNMVIDEALRLWVAHERAMEAQFGAPPSDKEAEERAAWRRIRRAAAADQLLRRS